MTTPQHQQGSNEMDDQRVTDAVLAASNNGDREPGPWPRAPDRRYTVLGLSEVLRQGMVHMAKTGQIVANPRTASLRLIDWYQREVSAGEQACPSGRHGYEHCSAYGRRMLAERGFLRGWGLALVRIYQCRQRQIAGAV